MQVVDQLLKHLMEQNQLMVTQEKLRDLWGIKLGFVGSGSVDNKRKNKGGGSYGKARG